MLVLLRQKELVYVIMLELVFQRQLNIIRRDKRLIFITFCVAQKDQATSCVFCPSMAAECPQVVADLSARAGTREVW